MRHIFPDIEDTFKLLLQTGTCLGFCLIFSGKKNPVKGIDGITQASVWHQRLKMEEETLGEKMAIEKTQRIIGKTALNLRGNQQR